MSIFQQVLNIKSVWKSLDLWISVTHGSDNDEDICQHLDHAIASIQQSNLLYWKAASILQHIKDNEELSFFNNVRVVPFLEPDIAPAISSYIDNEDKESTTTSSWLLGGLSKGFQSGHRFLGGSFVTVSIEAAKAKKCFRASSISSNMTSIESQDVFIVQSALPPEYNEARSSSADFHRITMMLKLRHDHAAESMNDPSQNDSIGFWLSKCAWYDESLSRWSPSGCATLDPRRRYSSRAEGTAGATAERTLDDNNEGVALMCECTHTTEFAVMMYTDFEAESHHPSIAGIDTDFPYFEMLRLHFGLHVMIMLSSLVTAFSSARVLVKADNAKNLGTVITMNCLVMASSVIHSQYSFMQLIFGSRHSIIRDWTWIVAPVLVALRFILHSCFALLVLTPLVRINHLSGGVTKILTRYKNIMKAFQLCIVIITAYLTVTKQLDAATVFVGIVSLATTLLYTIIVYRCYLVLSASHMPKTQHFSGRGSYGHIGTFLLSINALYGGAHIVQGALYLLSVFGRHIYSLNFHLLQAIFKWADALSLGASILYLWRCVYAVKSKRHC